MDEFNEKTELENDENPIPEESGENAELMEELEQIKDMFQQELDNPASDEVSEENAVSDDGILIQELDEEQFSDEDDPEGEESDEEEEISEEDLCRCCGEKRRDTSFGDDYPYCSDCRNLMKRNPFNAVGVIAFVIVLAVTCFATYFLSKNIDTYSSLLEAESAYEEGNLSTAAVGYVGYLRTADSTASYSKKAVKRAVEILTKIGSFDYSIDYIEQYFDEGALKLPWNKDVAKTYKYCQNLSKTSEFVSETFGDDMNSGDYDKVLKALDKEIKANESKEGEEKLNQVYLEYLKFYIMSVKGDDEQDVLDQLLKAKEVDETLYEGQNVWMYITYLIRQCSYLGDIDGAEKYFNASMEVNKQDLNCYICYADAYRYSLKKKSSDEEIEAAAQKILEIAESAAKAYESQFSYPSYYRIYAVSYLLSGKNDLAFKSMDSYFSEASQGLSIADYNLYALSALAVGDTEKFDTVRGYLLSGGYDLADSVIDFSNGKGKLYNILIDNGGDI